MKKTDSQNPFHSSFFDPEGPIILEGALREEIICFLSSLEEASEQKLGPYRSIFGLYQKQPVVVLQTEENSSNAAASTALAIERYHPSAVINQGTAGAHDPNLHTFDIVLGTATEAAGAWQSENVSRHGGADFHQITIYGVYGYDPSCRKFIKKPKYFCDEELLDAACSVKDSYEEGAVVKGVISTSDEWNNQVDRLMFLHKLTGSSCEEKESNAAAVICENYGIPFLAIRVISNSGIYEEPFNPETRSACQRYVLNVVDAYLEKRNFRMYQYC